MRGLLKGAANVLIASLMAGQVSAQGGEAELLRDALRTYRVGHEAAIVHELMELVALPNVAADSTGIRENAARLLAMLGDRGFATQMLESPGSPPAIFGELQAPGATRTVMLYAHYDGQPADSSQWEGSPWSPVLRDGALEQGGQILRPPETGYGGEWRIYGRSASDDKAPIVAALRAIDALTATGTALSVNVKMFLEGEEEAGSPHLRDMLQRHAPLLDADVWLFMDGPIHQSRTPQVVFGVRGIIGLQLTVFGADRVLHSGHYGNWAPNPAIMLARLVASMRDEEGRILIDGFYDDVRDVTSGERRAMLDAPSIEDDLMRSLEIGRIEGDGRLLERTAYPALNVQGLAAGNVGVLARNAIPIEATAAFDFRLVPNQRPERIRELVEGHLRRLGYAIVYERPDSMTRTETERVILVEWGDGYPAQRTPVDAPVSRAVTKVVAEATEAGAVVVPGLGGSLPLYVFQEVLARPLVIVPVVNHDNNQHGPNENVRLQNLWDGIEIYGALLARLGRVWGPGA